MALKGKDNAEKIWNYFKGKGMNDFAIAGIMGNIQQESGCNPKNLQNTGNKKLGMTDDEYTVAVDNGTYTNFVKDSQGYGLVQLTFWTRKQKFLKYVQSKKKSIGDLETQLDFIYNKELCVNYKKSVLDKLKTAASVCEASDIFLFNYEKPADQSEKAQVKRANYGQGFYDLYAEKEKLYYRVQTGSFSKRANADALQKKLKTAGFSAIIKEVDGLFKVQVGAYSEKKNADAMYDKLKKKGYSCFIVYDGDKKKEDESTYPLVALSAGHGKDTAGKRCKKSIDPNETREWFLNDRIIDMVEKELKNYKCRILRVNDTTGKVDTPLKTRTDAANNANADVYLSMHHNAGLNGRSGGGTQVYYYSSNPERKTQSKALYDAIVKETKLVGNRSDKIIKKSFHEVRESNMPAYLVENGFMDSLTDTPIILTEEHAKKTAKGVVNFLVNLLELQKR